MFVLTFALPYEQEAILNFEEAEYILAVHRHLLYSVDGTLPAVWFETDRDIQHRLLQVTAFSHLDYQFKPNSINWCRIPGSSALRFPVERLFETPQAKPGKEEKTDG